jgi:hypothetical protein
LCLQTSSHHCVFLFADIECQDCVGSFLVDQGQNDEEHDSLLDCQNCSAGTEFVNITTECSICGGGKYQETDNTVSAVCKLCPVGLYIDISAVDQCSSQNDAVARDPSQHASLESCKTCPKGYEINGTDRTQCIICGFSKYQDQNDVPNVKCETCLVNQYITDDRNGPAVHDSRRDCLACTDGKFAAAGARVCESCTAGKQQENSSCVDCVVGRFSTPVMYGKLLEELACTDCPKGYYQSEKGTPYW